MATCFVMQPFDGGVFDKRYADVFAPAIADAGLEPYRVDLDPKVSIPIQDIETGIRDASICLAEITLDNPNVWFELGFAIAMGKQVILVCSSDRTTKFPFDIQHRTVIRYLTSSTSDFDKLKGDLTSRMKACLQKAETLSNISDISKLTKIEGLEQLEVIAIVSLAQNLDNPDESISGFQIKRDMENSGFTKIASTLALKGLTQKGLIECGQFHDDHSDEYYSAYKLTEIGWAWILENKHRFVLERPKAVDDLPF